MRFKPALVGFLAVPLSILAATYVPAYASDNLKPPSVKQRDNSGRQIAVLVPAAEGENEGKDGQSAKTNGVAQMLNDACKKVSDEFAARNITVKVPEVSIPEDLANNADTCYKVCKDALTFAREHTYEVSVWFGKYLKQLTSPPRMTPCASPYLMNDRVIPPGLTQLDARLLLTHEGRLKTVVTH